MNNTISFQMLQWKVCFFYIWYKIYRINFVQNKQHHRLTRANTPASVSFRRFLPFSPWRASARLRLKSQKSLVNSSLAGALQFCRSRNVPRQGKTRREYCRILKGLDAVWGHFCPSKPCLPLSIDGTFSAARLLLLTHTQTTANTGEEYWRPDTQLSPVFWICSRFGSIHPIRLPAALPAPAHTSQ